MKQTLKITILMLLMTIVTLSLASCNDLLKNLPSNSETTPQDLVTIGCTTTPEPEGSTPGPEEITPEPHVHTMGEWVTTQEPTCTAVGSKERACSKCGEKETVTLSIVDHSWSAWTDIGNPICTGEGSQERTCSVCGIHVTQNATGTHTYAHKQWGICTVCDYVDLYHEHIIEDGKCKYCDYVWFAVEHPSMYDNDGDGVTETYLMAAALPEKFRSENAIHIDAFLDELDGENSKKEDEHDGHWDQLVFPYRHIYCNVYSELGADDYLLYNVTVEEAGVYELVVHLYVNNDKNRCAEYIINEGTPSEYSFKTSHGWANLDSTCLDIRNNDHLKGIYMLGIRVELQAGENTIKITGCDLEKPQLFRDFYLIKVEE